MVTKIQNKSPQSHVGFEQLLEAITLASYAHRHQTRKDGKTPYISHPYRVMTVLRHIFEVTDESILIAAILHDTIEDTTTDFDDIRDKFGADIASWVGMLSKDKRLPDEAREPLYYDVLAKAPDAVKLVKLADLYDNTVDSRKTLPAEKQAKHTQKSKEFLERLQKGNMSSDVKRAAEKLAALF